MKYIGLLVGKNDRFAEIRSELLVGPMRLANLIPVRFTGQDIDETDLSVAGQCYLSDDWTHSSGIRISCILDLTTPRAQRTEAEKRLLENRPHSTRIDLDCFELFQMLVADREFNRHIVPSRLLASFDDLLEASREWSKVIVKPRLPDLDFHPIVVERYSDKWLLTSYDTSTSLDENQLHNYLDSLRFECFLQPYQPLLTSQGRAYVYIVTLQQRYDFGWMEPVVHSVAGPGELFASMAAGGEYEGSPFIEPRKAEFLEKNGKDTSHAVILRLQGFSIELAKRIETVVGGMPAALGFKFGLDQSQQPVLLGISTRPSAPCFAARNMEFCKHLTGFCRGLIDPAIPDRLSNHSLSRQFSESHFPREGVSIRTYIAPDVAESLTKIVMPWLDLSLGNGGRYALQQICASVASGNSYRPYISLRLGALSNDAAVEKAGIPRLSGLVEYAGKRLVNWPEIKTSRCIRAPLLEAQFCKALTLTGQVGIDMIFIDDFDLGMQAVPADQREEELLRTIAWLDGVCQAAFAHSWGMSVSNCNNPQLSGWLDKAIELSADKGYFSCILVRMRDIKSSLAKRLLSGKPEVVVLVANEKERDTVTTDCLGVATLFQLTSPAHD